MLARTSQKRVCLNIGCGDRPTKGLINYDYNVFIILARFPGLISLLSKGKFVPEPFIHFMNVVRVEKIKYCDASKKIPENSKSIDLVYSCHMLELLDKSETNQFLGECKRILKPGSILRLVVPDFDQLIRNYNNDKNVEKFIKESCLVGEKPKNIVKKIQYLIQGHGWHHQMFTQNSLKKVLISNGFKDIKFFQAGKTGIPFKTNINYSDFSGISLYCECKA